MKCVHLSVIAKRRQSLHKILMVYIYRTSVFKNLLMVNCQLDTPRKRCTSSISRLISGKYFFINHPEQSSCKSKAYKFHQLLLVPSAVLFNSIEIE